VDKRRLARILVICLIMAVIALIIVVLLLPALGETYSVLCYPDYSTMTEAVCRNAEGTIIRVIPTGNMPLVLTNNIIRLTQIPTMNAALTDRAATYATYFVANTATQNARCTMTSSARMSQIPDLSLTETPFHLSLPSSC
jgi:hypothetical protein